MAMNVIQMTMKHYVTVAGKIGERIISRHGEIHMIKVSLNKSKDYTSIFTGETMTLPNEHDYITIHGFKDHQERDIIHNKIKHLIKEYKRTVY